jgi:sugar lactone lactonase YvrE
MQLKYLFGGLTDLGESPVWHPDMNLFFWTDLKGKKIFSLDLNNY